MRISSYNPSDRYRQRALTRFKGAFVFVLMCVVIGGIGFWLGRFYEGQTSVALNNEVERLQAQHVEFESALTEANAQAQTAMTRYEELEATVSDVVTQGPMQELLVVLKAQLDNGVDEFYTSFQCLRKSTDVSANNVQYKGDCTVLKEQTNIFDRFTTGMQMLKNFCNDLSLSRCIFFSHCSIN